MKKTTSFEDIYTKLINEETDITQEQSSIKTIIEELKKNPIYNVLWMPSYNYYRIRYKGKAFYEKYDRNKLCPGWGLYNDIKKLWKELYPGESEAEFNKFKISPYENSVVIKL